MKGIIACTRIENNKTQSLKYFIVDNYYLNVERNNRLL